MLRVRSVKAEEPTADPGLFGPHSITWRVDRELAVLLGSGARALLLQVAHPKVAAAVAEHSRYRSDPLGRLRDTLNAIYCFAFEDSATVERTVGRIRALHARVRGLTPEGERYSALDPHLLLWVYATLIDSSLVAFETFVAPLTYEEREAYYLEFRQAGPIWGIPPHRFPGSLLNLRTWMDGLIASGEVSVSPTGRQVGRFVLAPRTWWLPPPAVGLMNLTTVGLLPPVLRNGFGFTWDPNRERALRAIAALSRGVVPHLPPVLRYMPIARRAAKRVRRR